MGNPHGTPKNLIPCKPGETANPNGRPKGARSRSTIYREILEQYAKNLKIPQVKKLMEQLNAPSDITLAELIALKNSTLALAGNALGIKASEHVEDSVYGRITQKTEITGADGEALIKEQVAAQFKDLSVDQLNKIKAIIEEGKK